MRLFERSVQFKESRYEVRWKQWSVLKLNVAKRRFDEIVNFQTTLWSVQWRLSLTELEDIRTEWLLNDGPQSGSWRTQCPARDKDAFRSLWLKDLPKPTSFEKISHCDFYTCWMSVCRWLESSCSQCAGSCNPGASSKMWEWICKCEWKRVKGSCTNMENWTGWFHLWFEEHKKGSVAAAGIVHPVGFLPPFTIREKSSSNKCGNVDSIGTMSYLVHRSAQHHKK